MDLEHELAQQRAAVEGYKAKMEALETRLKEQQAAVAVAQSQKESVESSVAAAESDKVLWLGGLLPRLLTTPNGSQRLPTAPYDYKHTLLLFSSSMTPTDFHLLPPRELTPQPNSLAALQVVRAKPDVMCCQG